MMIAEKRRQSNRFAQGENLKGKKNESGDREARSPTELCLLFWKRAEKSPQG